MARRARHFIELCAQTRDARAAIIEAYHGPTQDLLDAADRNGNTALHLACEMQYEQLALWLATSGARKDARNGDGKLPSELGS